MPARVLAGSPAQVAPRRRVGSRITATAAATAAAAAAAGAIAAAEMR